VLIEKASSLGGNTLLAGGGLDGAGTKWQRAAGVDYPPAKLSEDLVKVGENKGSKPLIDLLTAKSGDALAFLESAGLKIRLPDPVKNPTRHQAETGSTGSETVRILLAAAKGKGVTVDVNTTATEIVVDSKGVVTGVKATGADKKTVYYNAKATIIATGGFGANAQMLADFARDWAGIGADLASKTSTGDGIRLARVIGADLVNTQYLRAFPTVTNKGAAVRGLETAGAIFVNKKGERFVNELDDNNVVSMAEIKQEGRIAFAVFANEFAKASEATVKALSDAGVLESAERIEDLAAKIQVPPAALKATINEYNKAQAQKVDANFKRPSLPLPIKEPRFFAVAMHPAVYATLGGLKINDSGQVTKGGAPVPGLWAAGEVVGGIFGTNKPGVVAATSNIVFGRLAAQSAVKSFKK
jgi:fumarate reductase flavoprotein subunit